MIDRVHWHSSRFVDDAKHDDNVTVSVRTIRMRHVDYLQSVSLWLRDELGENSYVVQETLSVCNTLRRHINKTLHGAHETLYHHPIQEVDFPTLATMIISRQPISLSQHETVDVTHTHFVSPE